MGEYSKIEWTDHTFNPWRGCSKVSAGCANCYAESMAKRFPEIHGIWGDGGTRIIASPAMWNNPVKWYSRCKIDGIRERVFCGSMCDVFEDRRELYAAKSLLYELIIATPNLDWLLLTKRPENIGEMLPENWLDGLPKNVWLGTSVENQEMADLRIPELLKIPAAIRFLSIEPMLGPVDLSPWMSKIGWVICGCESGPNARMMHPMYVRDLRCQCDMKDVPFFLKQMIVNGKLVKMPKLDGKQHAQLPPGEAAQNLDREDQDDG